MGSGGGGYGATVQHKPPAPKPEENAIPWRDRTPSEFEVSRPDGTGWVSKPYTDNEPSKVPGGAATPGKGVVTSVPDAMNRYAGSFEPLLKTLTELQAQVAPGKMEIRAGMFYAAAELRGKINGAVGKEGPEASGLQGTTYAVISHLINTLTAVRTAVQEVGREMEKGNFEIEADAAALAEQEGWSWARGYGDKYSPT